MHTSVQKIFLKELILLFSKDALLIKSDSKDCYNYKIYISNKGYASRNPQQLSRTTVFNNDNKKCFLSTKSAY